MKSVGAIAIYKRLVSGLMKAYVHQFVVVFYTAFNLNLNDLKIIVVRKLVWSKRSTVGQLNRFFSISRQIIIIISLG